ncbi:metal-responsive CopG/Arc/MetJ family transcriptional regulator [Natronocella acetinitrilica]|uniref:Metal-responsive CopG/Arc/MetJ family transcriptional regulator n=1 Tax=Natronocella acetinitrilica TaxID=414046 RepID=A0AAE3G424_9GAMM|nr:metal-responsive CopG/Arc/MetJ family transcriptional regulator [Natronocella acetinitrilica]
MRTIIDLPDDQVELLKQLSKQSRLSRAELVRRAVADYLQRNHSNNGEEAFGIWRHKQLDGVEYQRRLRAEWDA